MCESVTGSFSVVAVAGVLDAIATQAEPQWALEAPGGRRAIGEGGRKRLFSGGGRGRCAWLVAGGQEACNSAVGGHEAFD